MPGLKDCANYIIMMFSDMPVVTMQNLMHDGGFSHSGITEEIVEMVKAQVG